MSFLALISAFLGKSQLISKGLVGILNSSKKPTIKFDLTTMIPQVDLFLSFFLEECDKKDISKSSEL